MAFLVYPDLPRFATRAVGDRVRLAAVVGVGVGDHHELDVLQLQPNDVQQAPAFSESERGLDGALDVFFNGKKRRGLLPGSVQISTS